MKKIFLSICLLSLVSFSVSAYDWGGVFNNSTQFAYNDKAGSSPFLNFTNGVFKLTFFG